MVKKSVTIDVEDDEGAVYHMRVTGNVTREKVLNIFESLNLVDLEQPGTPKTPNTVGGRIWGIIDQQYPVGDFTSIDVLEKYEDEYNLPIKLSVVSTYLARFAQKGQVARQKRGRKWSYQTRRTTSPGLGN